MYKQTKPPGSDSDANFLGWQGKLSEELFPLFNITAVDHPFYQSTASESTLRRLHLRVPRIPSPYPETEPSPWHNLGIELNHPKTAREAIEMAGLNYTVMEKPLELNPGLKQDAYATVRTDTHDVLGFVKKSYEPIQNIDAFTFFDDLVAENEAIYETAGVLGKGECIWILAKLPGYINVRGNDIVNKYLLLTNSHDGSSYVRVKLTPIRVVCNNTLTSALQGAGEVQISHTPNAARDLEQAVTMLGLSNYLYKQLSAMFNGMAAKKITEEQLREYVQALVPDNE
jgi:phage/plasmid-like protein (TIGR03299 family)